jgi:hypothetical protein
VSITLAQLARAKGFSTGDLERFGVRERDGCVEIPYCNEDGSESRYQARNAVADGEGFFWGPGDGTIAYGLDRPVPWGSTLYAVEGPSDCWALWIAGKPALGVPGASNVACLASVDFSAAEIVAVIQEPGAAGERFPYRVATTLRANGFKGSIFALRLGEFKDARAAFQGARERFDTVLGAAWDERTEVTATSEHAALSTPETSWTLRSAADIMRKGVPPVEWDIDTLLPAEDGPALMFGPPGTLKSWIALLAAGCSATGNSFLGHFAVRRRPHAIYVNFDAGPRAFDRRVERSGYPVENLKVVSPHGYDTGALRLVFAQHRGAFIVVDTLSDMYDVSRGDDPALAMRSFFRDLRALYQEFGCNGFIVDHPHRPRDGAAHGDYYGSIQKEATARIMWQLTPLSPGEPGVARAKIACRKLSEAEPFPPFVVRLNFNPKNIIAIYDGQVSESGVVAQGPSDVEIIAQVLRGVGEGITRSAIQFRTGIARDRVRDALKDPRFSTRGQGKAIRYALRESDGPPGDSPRDSARGSRESNGSPATPEDAFDPGDSKEPFEGEESNGAPGDQTPADRLTLFEDTLL